MRWSGPVQRTDDAISGWIRLAAVAASLNFFTGVTPVRPFQISTVVSARRGRAKTAKCTGRVVDDQTGMPIANFHVRVMGVRYSRGEAIWSGGTVLPTDEEGRFVSKDREPGNYVAQVVPQVLSRLRGGLAPDGDKHDYRQNDPGCFHVGNLPAILLDSRHRLHEAEDGTI
jgi:hypothetical protein